LPRAHELTAVNLGYRQLTEASNVSSVLPGSLVSALITAVVPSGLNVKICGFYDGTIDLTHLGIGDEEVESKFKIGKKVRLLAVKSKTDLRHG
jgi:ribosomal protein S1